YLHPDPFVQVGDPGADDPFDAGDRLGSVLGDGPDDVLLNEEPAEGTEGRLHRRLFDDQRLPRPAPGPVEEADGVDQLAGEAALHFYGRGGNDVLALPAPDAPGLADFLGAGDILDVQVPGGPGQVQGIADAVDRKG